MIVRDKMCVWLGSVAFYLPQALTFSNSTFCSHTVFMCFVWIWD